MQISARQSTETFIHVEVSVSMARQPGPEGKNLDDDPQSCSWAAMHSLLNGQSAEVKTTRATMPT